MKIAEYKAELDLKTLRELKKIPLFEMHEKGWIKNPMPMFGADYFFEVIETLIEMHECKLKDTE